MSYRDGLIGIAKQFIKDSPASTDNPDCLLALFARQIDDTLEVYDLSSIKSGDEKEACSVLWTKILEATYIQLLELLREVMTDSLVQNLHFPTSISKYQVDNAIAYLKHHLSLIEVFNHCMDGNREVWLKCVEFVQGENKIGNGN